MNEGGMSKYYLDAMDKTMPIDNRRNTKKKRNAPRVRRVGLFQCEHFRGFFTELRNDTNGNAATWAIFYRFGLESIKSIPDFFVEFKMQGSFCFLFRGE